MLGFYGHAKTPHCMYRLLVDALRLALHGLKDILGDPINLSLN